MAAHGRVLVGLLVGVLLVSLTPAAAANETALVARGIERVCPVPTADDADDAASDDEAEDTEAADDPRFPDIGTTHADAIDCAAAYGLVSGFGDGTFRPNEPITREQMASFIAAWLRTATGVSLKVPEEPRFDDVVGGVHAGAIDALAAVGIVGGRADGTFGPTETLTRGQFTRAVANAISYADIFATDGPLPPPAPGVAFTDTLGTTFEDTIHRLAGVGIALGTGDGAFSPTDPVTRGQLSTFLMRSADHLDEYQRWRPTALPEVAMEAVLQLVVALTPGDDDDGDGAGDGGDGQADAGQEDDQPDPTFATVGEVTLGVDAFGATLTYELILSEALGPYAPSQGLTLHLGDPATAPEPVLVLATGDELDASTDGVVSGTVFEAASSVRFVQVLTELDRAYLQLSSAAFPEGVARGGLVLRPA